MASIVLGAVGAAVGGYFGNPELGYQIGSALGGMLEKGPNTQGPRLSDLKVQGSTYGASIPIYYGTARGAGQVIWSSDLIEVADEEEVGGKGGGPTYTSYTYYVNCAVAVCEGEISGVSRIWANGKIVMDVRPENTGATGASPNIRVYTGSETQNPDSLLESYLGVGNVPAHRGLAYIVFQNFPLEEYGNRLPNFTFEVINNGTLVNPDNQMIVNNSPVLHIIPHPFYEGIFLATTRNDDGAGTSIFLHVIDAIEKTDISIPINVTNSAWASGYMTYIEWGTDPLTGLPFEVNELWINTVRNSYEATNEVAVAFDINSLSFKRRIIPVQPIGITYAGKFVYDKTNHFVLVMCSGSTTGDGVRYLEPISLEWESGVFYGPAYTGSQWYITRALTGKYIIGAINYHNYMVFFSAGVVGAKHTGMGSTLWGQGWTYDTRRDRWIGFSRNVSSLAVFRSFEEKLTAEFPEEDIYTSNTGMNEGGTLEYWPIADKFSYREGDTLHFLNANTMQIEYTIVRDMNSSESHSCFEIPNLVDYALGYVNGAPGYGVARIPLAPRIASGQVVLSDIVEDICSRADLLPSDINTLQLTDVLDGYIITQQMTARAAIESLQSGYFFDAVESD